MKDRHLALIVEDDKATAEDLAEILRSIGCDSVTVESHHDALAELGDKTFCLILLDLQIKEASDAIKGHVEHGKALLREIRRAHGDHAGVPYWMPILIVSGFAREVSAAVDVMKDGASDVIQKPFNSREVSQTVRRALESSGRLTHDLCGEKPTPPRFSPDRGIVLAISGDRVRRRTCVEVGGKKIELTDSSLKVLLHLMVAHGKGKGVHKIDLGASGEQGFKGISILRSDIKPALSTGVDIIENDYHGNYNLAAGVTIGRCATDKLHKIGDAAISALARQLHRQLQTRRKKV